MLKCWRKSNRFLRIILLCTGLVVPSLSIFAAESVTLPEPRYAELKNLLLQDCGSCHGIALTPEALQDRPRELIELTILNGRSGTPMPPWKDILTREEINWLVDTLYAGVTR